MSKVCEKELNAQLQAVMARLDSLEENVASQWETMILNIVKTVAGMAAITTNGSVGAAILSADPNLALLLGGDIEALLKALPGLDFRKLLLTIAADRLGNSLAADLMNDVETALNDAVTAATTALAQAIAQGASQAVIDDLQAALDAANAAAQSATDFFGVINNATACKTAASILGL